jgi:hypothetical protein
VFVLAGAVVCAAGAVGVACAGVPLLGCDAYDVLAGLFVAAVAA